MREGAKARGNPTILFEHPDGPIADPSKAKQLAELQQNYGGPAKGSIPPLPPGFIMTTHMGQVSKWQVPQETVDIIGEERAIALEVLDELLAAKFNVHILMETKEMVEMGEVKLAI